MSLCSRSIRNTLCAALPFGLFFLATPALATSTILISDIGSTGTTTDATIFNAAANPTEPSTGTGVFEPFVRIEATGNSSSSGQTQNGYNTDVDPGDSTDVNFDTKGGSDWTRAITFGELGVVEVGGVSYYQFLLDANEEGKAGSQKNQILLTDVQIYIGGSEYATPEESGGYTGEAFNSENNFLLDSNAAPVWTLDSAVNGDVDVLLNASICDSAGQCGSGHGDLEMLIQMSVFQGVSPDDFLVFYTEYDMAGRPSGGFEEWSVRVGNTPIPEPGAALVFAIGMAFTSARVNARRRT